jgi:hypothetical protein
MRRSGLFHNAGPGQSWLCHPVRGRIAMMPASEADYERVLTRAAAYSQTWLGSRQPSRSANCAG